MLACVASNSGSMENDPNHTGGSSSSSSHQVEVDLLSRNTALERVSKHWFSTKKRLETTQSEYYKVASDKEKRDAMPDLDKMLKKLGFSSYAEFKTLYRNLYCAQLKIIDDFWKIAYSEKNGKILKITINSIPNIDQDPFYSHIFQKMPDTIFANDSRYFPSGSHNKIIDDLKFVLVNEGALRQYNLREIILDPNLPVDLFPTLFKELIQLCRALDSLNTPLNTAHFADDAVIDSALQAYRSFQEEHGYYQDGANLRASCKAINDQIQTR